MIQLLSSCTVKNRVWAILGRKCPFCFLLEIPDPLIQQLSFIFSLVLFDVIIEDFGCFGFNGCEIAPCFPMFFVLSIISDWYDGTRRFSIFAFEMFLVGEGRKCPFYVYLRRFTTWFCSFQLIRLLRCAHGARPTLLVSATVHVRWPASLFWPSQEACLISKLDLPASCFDSCL
jgi:hypothetical protein